ncbi:MAG TPA: translation elongation factor Ts [Bacillota bacterium]|jgi:elongation factor Ts|nr:translation elongation factor Ts [Candidatus Fermentithermobacillaceae bacterium]HOB29986.1 translation elongation factor Ts [Bacillota bacterium]HOK63857.1 translation elongation factor Ts [Bacillota bacterium]HOL11455.1 translation elongation factor Ts [Bacillota bacterium]HOQ03185.1 translation elongation factor Ts [Bacillota bacterium]
MAEVTVDMIRELRSRTGAGMMDCKKALEETGGDIEKAVDLLRKKGLAEAAKKAGRTAKEGIVTSYIHHNRRVGVLLELNCETDFVARTDQFEQLAKDIAMHIAMANPQYVSRNEVPEEVIEHEKTIEREKAEAEGKPEQVIEKIVEGKISKLYENICLLEQPFIKDNSKTIGDLINEAIVLLGENIVVGRFARFEVGGQ